MCYAKIQESLQRPITKYLQRSFEWVEALEEAIV